MALTLDQMAQFVTKKVGQTDATSVAICKDFLKNRASFLWDASLWRDTQLSVFVNTVAGESDLPMPSGMERVIAIRAGGQYVDPVDSAFLIETDPTIFERSGVPTVYEEFTDSASNAKKIRLKPVPNAIISLLVIGKRTMPALADSDSLILRNLDNCLIAFAQADMLQRQRQYGKAKELVEEGAALLAKAQEVENGQAARARRSKNISVSGDSLAELVDAVCARCGLWTFDYVLLARDFVRRNYLRIYDAHLWPESKVIYTATSTGSHIVLPDHIAQVIKVRYADNLPQLEVADLGAYFDLAPGIFEDTATQPLAYSVLTPVGVSLLPTAAEKLKVISSSSADKSNVFIRGETAAGLELTETIALNGTAEVNGVNTILTPLTVSKGLTTGTISIAGVTTGFVYQQLLPAERERKHIRLWIQPRTGVAASCLILGKRKIKPLQADEDTPMIRGIGDALICSAAADLILSTKGDANLASQYKKDAANAVQSLIDQFTQQAAYSQQVVPMVEPFAYAETDDSWHVAKL